MTQMKLNHLNLAVNDVQGTQTFLEKYFGLKAMAGMPGNEAISLLFDANGMVLTLMKNGEQDVKYPGTFHIGFIQESEEKVNEINQRLKDDGFDVNAPRHFHGSWTFYLQSPGGFLVEVLH